MTTQYCVYTCLFGRNLRQYEKCIFWQRKIVIFSHGVVGSIPSISINFTNPSSYKCDYLEQSSLESIVQQLIIPANSKVLFQWLLKRCKTFEKCKRHQKGQYFESYLNLTSNTTFDDPLLCSLRLEVKIFTVLENFIYFFLILIHSNVFENVKW